MRRIWLSSGTLVMLIVFSIMLTKAAREAGIMSSSFLWSTVICAVVGTVALTVRYCREQRSRSNGQHHNNQQPCGSN